MVAMEFVCFDIVSLFGSLVRHWGLFNSQTSFGEGALWIGARGVH